MRAEVTPNTKPTTSNHTPPPPPYNHNSPAAALKNTSTTQTTVQKVERIQPPAHRQPAQRQHPQQLQQPQNDSLQDEAYIPDHEESFSYSDDDAFLAAVDLGEIDMGQPIDFEEGTRAVDAGESTLSAGSSGSSSVVKGRGSMGPPAGIGTKNEQLNANGVAGQPPQRPQRPVEQKQTNSNSNLNTSTTRNQNSHQNILSNPANTTTPKVNHSGQQDRVQHSNPSSDRSSRADPSSRSTNSNQNYRPQNTNTNANGALSRKPLTPSMGGFHFPPDMVRRFLESSRVKNGSNKFEEFSYNFQATFTPWITTATTPGIWACA